MIVMKFGGTSVQDAKAIDRVAQSSKASSRKSRWWWSARMAKVTDQLLAMARRCRRRRPQDCVEALRRRCERHYSCATDLGRDLLGTAAFTQFHGELGADFETLEELLRGIVAVGELTPRTTDYCLRVRRKVSSARLSRRHSPRRTCHLRSWTPASGMVTDSAHMRAVPQFEETNQRLQAKGAPLLARQSAGHGRLHRASKAGHHHDDRPRRVRLFRCHIGRWPGSRTDRNMDRRGRHDDNRPAHCAPTPGASR